MPDGLIDSIYTFSIRALLVLGVVYLLSGLDDFLIDLVAFIKRLKPHRLTKDEIQNIKNLPEKQIAIMVPAWDEGHIIERMLVGNIQGIEYKNYHIFVGVYPNDMVTVEAVQRVQKKYPFVHPVINVKPGPTSKGQILNLVVQEARKLEKEIGSPFEGFLMQDSEDLIHSKALKLVNYKLETYDFVQIPVFSLEVSAKQLVAGTYIDEFAESHTKDIIVRNFLGGPVPSAGVGTAMKRDLVEGMLLQQEGQLFNEGSVTEDYELGIRAHAHGFKPHFACVYYYLNQKKEFIATREYFPKKFNRSVRQKTRWTIGIALQGWRNLGWQGNWVTRYFLLRDRKGLLTNIATLFGYFFFLLAISLFHFTKKIVPQGFIHVLYPVFFFNLGLMGLRFFQRSSAVYRVYGFQGVWPILFRWPVACIINAFACVMAIKRDIISRYTNKTIQWVKTEHELPKFFGTTTLEVEGASK